jgi:hypothetical protein
MRAACTRNEFVTCKERGPFLSGSPPCGRFGPEGGVRGGFFYGTYEQNRKLLFPIGIVPDLFALFFGTYLTSLVK